MSDNQPPNNPIAESEQENNNHADQAAEKERGNFIPPNLQDGPATDEARGQNPNGSKQPNVADLEAGITEGREQTAQDDRESQGKATGKTTKANPKATGAANPEETSGVKPAQSITTVTGTGRPEPRPANRPSELERRPDLKDKIVAYLSAGNRIENVCNLVGIAPSTFYQWMQRGEGTQPDRPAEPIFVDFVEAVKRAQGYAEASRLTRIEKAGKGGDIASVKRFYDKQGNLVSEETTYTRPQWQADAWMLERAIPEAWGRRLDINAKIQGMSTEQLAEFVLEGVLVDSSEAEEDED